jgi:large subunit ribosomal protein L22
MNKSLTATLKYALVSDKKMSLMAKLVQGKRVQEALDILNVMPKKAGKILAKVIKSAYSNAKNS